MNWLNIKTEYTFGAVYGHLKQVAQSQAGGSFAGIADLASTWGHIKWRTYCKENDLKPIYGVMLAVSNDLERVSRKYPFDLMTFIARTNKGLQKIYEMVDIAHQQFYWRPRLSYDQINELPQKDIALLTGSAPNIKAIKREVLLLLTPATPSRIREIKSIPAIAGIDNNFISPSDRIIYEPFADVRKLERKTSTQHIISRAEWLVEYPGCEEALKNLDALGEDCNADIPNAPMVKFYKKANIDSICRRRAKTKNINLKNPIYKQRYDHEIKLIKEKEYVDYFLMVSDAIKYAKKHMAVGPSRGSSAGSLVCYLMDITEVDPILWGLYFERFIDVNRFDLPDIDVDFQDDKRHLVIKYLQKKYGSANVAQIGNVNRLKPRSAITRFAKALNVPAGDAIEVKDAILERSVGDARAAFCMADTFNDTDVGKRFLEEYPAMKTVAEIESHASHAGVHAAGILVANDPITKYCGINSRDKKRIGMLDKKDAESIDLLKIDALGLRTLTILAGVCDQINKPYEWLYSLPLNDPKAYQVFNDQRLEGIFQFEGFTTRSLSRQMPIENMEDISAMVAIARPGPVVSGGATSYIEARTGKKEAEYISKHPAVVAATKNTFGVVIYQEQVLKIAREYGLLNWEDTSQLRKAMSKSLGEEFFDQYKKRFIKGAKSLGEKEEDAERVWKYINTFGSWGMNKAHTISYSVISYWCAYMKAHYMLEFAVSSLNHSKDDQTALKMLRDLVESENIKYVVLDPKISQKGWSVYDGKLYGGLCTVNGIGPAKTNQIIESRKIGKPLPPSLASKLVPPIDSPFQYLYPARQKYGDYYCNPMKYGISRKVKTIGKVTDNGHHVIIGNLIHKNVRDANEIVNAAKRGGEYLTGPTTWLNLTIEDDTDLIICTIGRYQYEEIGREIAETGKENKDWYLIYGIMKNNYRKLFVKNIRRITI